MGLEESRRDREGVGGADMSVIESKTRRLLSANT